MTNLNSQTDRELWGLRGAVKAVNDQYFHQHPALFSPKPSISRIEFAPDGSLATRRAEIPFSFDDAGRKRRVRSSGPGDYRPSTSAGGSPFSIADRRPNFPQGGTATIYYDEFDRPVEAEVRESGGGFVMRAERSYDELGRTIVEKLSMLDPAAFFPADLHPDFPGDKRAVAQAGDWLVRFVYDSENRVVRIERSEPSREEVVVTSYNTHHDPAIEITTTESTITALPAYSEVRYSYQYDQAGNWTEKAAERRLRSEDPWEPTVTIRRTLEYF